MKEQSITITEEEAERDDFYSQNLNPDNISDVVSEPDNLALEELLENENMHLGTNNGNTAIGEAAAAALSDSNNPNSATKAYDFRERSAGINSATSNNGVKLQKSRKVHINVNK